ncbi:putative RNA methyltransferase [Plasmodium gaboni]|uniref:Putative RNA methyltransferase n=1 Tax=Plasmodium gaboni TaxID=647221 RepID=A0A151LLD5_9APIC|nr:putative RNA methyltransferase [Plasmodium gaboni]KYN99687.1 putative RNA methyltransferase [Plasmodium gaboni]SOV23030.1 RNA methyltransferase, putative [Plasmodium sp. DRC-Itaito]
MYINRMSLNNMKEEKNNCNDDNLPTNGDINDNGMSIISCINNNLKKKDSDEKIKIYVVIYNIGKKKNVGSIVRSCVAFNVHKIFIVGKRKKEINFFGNMGTYDYITIEYFDNIYELKEYLKKNDILLYACEITANALSITTNPYENKDTAFLFGNEGTGIHDNVLKICDKIIYIPQYGKGTASLNVSVSCAIILQNFAVWANYEQAEIQNKKFIVQKKMSKLQKYLNPTDDMLKQIHFKRSLRSQKKIENHIISLENFI